MRYLLKVKLSNLVEIKLGNLCMIIDGCGLENESMKLLSKCQWRRLNELGLSSTPINDCYIDSVYCANWPLLNKVNLCNNCMI